jgi:hypothetical protein
MKPMPWTIAEAAKEAVKVAPPPVRELALEWMSRYTADSPELTGAFVCGMLAVLQPGALAPPPVRTSRPRPQLLPQGPQTESAEPDPETRPDPGAQAGREQGDPAAPEPAPFREEPEPSRPASASPPATLEAMEALCRAEGYTRLDQERPAFPGAGQYSREHEPGALWLWFPKSPQAPVRARLKRQGFKGVYEGTRTDRRGKVRPNFAGWRWIPATM